MAAGWSIVIGALLAACGADEGPVTAKVGALEFRGRAGASYFAGTKFFGFTATREGWDTQIEVRVEGLDPEATGTFEAGPTKPHEIRLEIGDDEQSTRSMGTGSIEIEEFTMKIDRGIGIGEGRVRGRFEARLDGVSIDDGVFDVPVTSSDICNEGVEARERFDCP